VPNARILVVDDDDAVRSVAERILTRAGYTVLTAADGPDGLLAAELDGPIDLLVTDLLMPQMYGDELARQLRTRYPRLLVLYLTAHRQMLFKKRPLLPAREGLLDKPFTIEELIGAVSLLIHARGWPRPYT
jgi:CheY-like chemotaxis protein